jgi:hypothetical protein
MLSESLVSKEMPSRVGVRSAIEENPNFIVLLSSIENLSIGAYSVLDLEINKGKITYNDFAIYEEEGKDLIVISDLLNQLEVAVSETEQRALVGQIAGALLD